MKKNKLILIIIFISVYIPLKLIADENYFFNPFVYENSKIKYYKYDESPWSEYEKIIAARGYLVMGCLADAIDLYRNLSSSSKWKELETEYAFALGLSGFYEESLLYLDNARKKDPVNPAPYFYAGIIYLFSGFSEIGLEMLKVSSGNNSPYDNIAKTFISENKTIGVLSFATINNNLRKLFNIDSDYGVVILNTYPGPEKFISDLKNGDLILSVNSKKTETVADIKNIINSSNIGDIIKVEILRNGKKINKSVKVFSRTGSLNLSETGKMTGEPEKKDLEKLTNTLSLMADENYFTSLYYYKKLMEKYPYWDLLYTGSILCLTNIGAFDNAIKYSEKALQLTRDKENKSQIKDKLLELKSLSYEEKNNWRLSQKKTEKESKRNFFIGFGGGQLSIGGDSGFSAFLKARAGLFLTDNMDFSTDVSYGTESGLGLGLNFIQRYYLIENTSLNYGITITYNTSSSKISAGLSGGGSYFTDKYTSYDLILNLILLPSQDISFYLGMTGYF
jgi:tetratricopeptide (TPR) repeat protein